MKVLYLWFLKLLAPLWKLLGVDTKQLLLILNTKMELALRKPISIHPTKKSKDLKLPNWTKELLRVGLSALFGLIYCAFLFIPNQEIALLYALFLYLISVSMNMILQFSTQLVDTTDNLVLLFRPVTNRTLVLYRLLFGIYQYLITAIPMALPMIVIVMIQSGVLQGGYFFALLLPALVLLFALVQMLIMVLLRIFSVKLFSKLITWLQGLMLIVFFICCQSGFWNKVQMLDLNFSLQYTRLLAFLPPYWIVSIWLDKAPVWMYFALFGIPLLFLWFILVVLSPKYSAKLSQLGMGPEVNKPKKKELIGITFKKKKFLILKNITAQSAFVMMRKYMSRTKEFKMGVLSSYYYVVIIAFPILLDIWKILQGESITIKDSKLLLPFYAFYFPVSMGITAICSSPSYLASWAAYAAPENIRGQIKLGSGWAVFSKLFVPGFLIWSAIILSITRFEIWSNLILAFANMLLLCMLNVWMTLKELPLTVPQQEQANKGFTRGIKIFLIMIIGVLVGGLHVMLLMKLYWWVHLLIATLDFIAAWLVMDKIAGNNA